MLDEVLLGVEDRTVLYSQEFKDGFFGVFEVKLFGGFLPAVYALFEHDLKQFLLIGCGESVRFCNLLRTLSLDLEIFVNLVPVLLGECLLLEVVTR